MTKKEQREEKAWKKLQKKEKAIRKEMEKFLLDNSFAIVEYTGFTKTPVGLIKETAKVRFQHENAFLDVQVVLDNTFNKGDEEKFLDDVKEAFFSYADDGDYKKDGSGWRLGFQFVAIDLKDNIMTYGIYDIYGE